ncbi:hypothetical protein INT47_011667 [Mucor saturninus]|uniref:Uncharacterized protein n=1 Tax=Mucor saturninus TaxID=64648 RepID=A0A8H7QJJ7_9FUNG|nr:hypothetical protein INT47_011667 [Mucor saturninus]
MLPFGYDGQSLCRKMTIGEVGFGHVKSDEFKAWVLAMSPYLLTMRLPKQYYDNWMDFVATNVYLSSPVISLEEVEKMHAQMMTFLDDFVDTYEDPTLIVLKIPWSPIGQGPTVVLESRNFPKTGSSVPDLLPHNTHLKTVLTKWGSGPSSWIFNFERYNCDVKSFKTNRRGPVEKTYMKKFLHAIHSEDYFKGLNSSLVLGPRHQVNEGLEGDYRNSKLHFSLSCFLALNHGHKVVYGYEELPPTALKDMKLKRPCNMNSVTFTHLLRYYVDLYHVWFDPFAATSRITTFITLNLFGAVFKSMESSCANARGSYIRAFYRLTDQEDIVREEETSGERTARHYKSISDSGVLRPAQVVMFFRHSVPESIQIQYLRGYDEIEDEMKNLLVEKFHFVQVNGVLESCSTSVVTEFDCEWPYNITTNVKGKLSVVQISYASSVLVLHLDPTWNVLPLSLIHFLKSPVILKIGRQVGGDFKQLKDSFGIDCEVW